MAKRNLEIDLFEEAGLYCSTVHFKTGKTVTMVSKDEVSLLDVVGAILSYDKFRNESLDHVGIDDKTMNKIINDMETSPRE